MQSGADHNSTFLIPSWRRANLLAITLPRLKKFMPDVPIIVLDDYGEEDHADPGSTLQVATAHDCTVVNTRQGDDPNEWRIPGFAINIGARMCDTERFVIMCPEMFVVSDPTWITEGLSNELRAPVGIDDRDGHVLNHLGHRDWHWHHADSYLSLMTTPPFSNCPPLNTKLPFLMGMDTARFIEIGGYDEDFIGCGYDDNDIVDRMCETGAGINLSCLAIHLYHPRTAHIASRTQDRYKYNESLYNARKGQTNRNVGREWGCLKAATR